MSTTENQSLSYTSRDYNSIYKELLECIPLLTERWNTDNESDPGIVLVKLMSMLGDMLSYNMDKQVLEMFPKTVTQRKNAYQIYNLLGYKMHWYISARCKATMYFEVSKDIVSCIPRYTKFITLDNNLTYTNIKTIIREDDIVTAELIQGIPKTPPMLVNVSSTYKYDSKKKWWSEYGYNMYKGDIDSENKYYLSDIEVDQDTICLCDDDGEWTLVEDVDTVTDTNQSYYANKFFSFHVDEYDRAYIKLCPAWNYNNKGAERFKLFYIISRGASGAISSNALTVYSFNFFRSITNESSTEGFDPETPEEAYLNSRNWINTNNTLITCNDFTKAVKRIAGVANAIVLDAQTDFQLYAEKSDKDYSEDTLEEMSQFVDVTLSDEPNNPQPEQSLIKNNEVRIYVIPDEDYIKSADDEDTALIELYRKINKYVQNNKILNLLQYTYFDGKYTNTGLASIATTNAIEHYKWTVAGTVYYKTPLEFSESESILATIDTRLKEKYKINNMEFNEPAQYMDVVNTILETDSRILYVDLKPLIYKRIDNGNIVDATEDDVTGKVHIEIDGWEYFNTVEYKDQANDPRYYSKHDTIQNYNPCSYKIDLYGGLHKNGIENLNVDEEYERSKNVENNSYIIDCNNDIHNFKIDKNDGYNRNYGNTLPIKPSSLTIKIAGNSNIYDDGNGNLISGIVEGENSVLVNNTGSVDYGRDTNSTERGVISFELRSVVNDIMQVEYYTNKLAIASYESFDTTMFFASPTSLKKK